MLLGRNTGGWQRLLWELVSSKFTVINIHISNWCVAHR
jgi:hypothetical protein